jgi:hypothetical protein
MWLHLPDALTEQEATKVKGHVKVYTQSVISEKEVETVEKGFEVEKVEVVCREFKGLGLGAYGAWSVFLTKDVQLVNTEIADKFPEGVTFHSAAGLTDEAASGFVLPKVRVRSMI